MLSGEERAQEGELWRFFSRESSVGEKQHTDEMQSMLTTPQELQVQCKELHKKDENCQKLCRENWQQREAHSSSIHTDTLKVEFGVFTNEFKGGGFFINRGILHWLKGRASSFDRAVGRLRSKIRGALAPTTN